MELKYQNTISSPTCLMYMVSRKTLIKKSISKN